VGAACDTALVEDAVKRMPYLSLDRQIRIGTGIQYDWNEGVTVGVAYEYLDAGEA
jgi:long-chain fatty acid transport protein